jgi:hypothetical protein
MIHHTTNHPNVKGFIDSFDKNDKIIKIKGWCFHDIYNICEIRLKYSLDNVSEIKFINYPINDLDNTRMDVIRSYNFDSQDKLLCGWKFEICEIENNVNDIELEMYFDEKWNSIFTFEKYFKQFYSKKISKYIPSFVVVDNFYENPDTVRNFALTKDFHYHVEYHKGKRTDEVFLFDGLKENFENILGCKIKDWTRYGVNGCFQYCIGGDQLVYHNDGQEYAGIIFLTPDAPPQSGTSFYRSRHTKKMKPEDDYHIVFKNGFLDPTEFDVVDVVGNRYNRLVLFDAKMIHAASNYFGTTKENGRLFQLFFFDLIRD